MLVPQERGQVLGGTGAAIGNEQEILGQIEVITQEMILLLDAGMAVAVAVEQMTGHRQWSQIIDDGGDAQLQHLVPGEVAVRDVSR